MTEENNPRDLISYTIQEAADVLGISRSELQRYTSNGDIKAELRSVGTGIRRARRYTAKSLHDFVEANPDLIGTEDAPQIQLSADDASVDDVEVARFSEPDDEDDEELEVNSVDFEKEAFHPEIETELPTPIPNPQNDPLTTSSGQQGGSSHFVFGLGATGVQIVDQARRSDHHARNSGFDSLETPYRFLVMDTSLDVNPEEPGSNTEEGFNKWFKQDDIIILSNLTGGAGRIPVVSEFIANYSLDPKLTEIGERTARLQGINTSYLIHSIGGGTGCGLAPKLARWLSDKRQGGTRIGITLLGNAQGTVPNPSEADNGIFAFPKVNEEMDLVVLIDNTTVADRYARDERTRIETKRYIHELEHVLLRGIPGYLDANKLYAASDRYAYRIVSSINRLPEDITNIITHLKNNERFASGAKWVLPYLYPLNADYEYDYRDVPPGLMVLRALEGGALCDPLRIRADSCAVVICEYPGDYPDEFVMNIHRDAQKIVSDVLHLKEANVRVIPFRSPGRGFAVTVLVAGNEPEIFRQWINDSEDTDKRKEIQKRWYQRVSSPDSAEPGAGDAWDTICRSTAKAVKDDPIEQESFFKELTASAIEWRTAGAEYDICEAFLEFVKRTGFHAGRGSMD